MDSTLHSSRQVRSTASQLSRVRTGGIGAQSRRARTGPGSARRGGRGAARPPAQPSFPSPATQTAL